MVYIARFKIFYGNILCRLKSAVEKLRQARYDIWQKEMNTMEKTVALPKAPQFINTDMMSVKEIHAELQKGYDDIIAGRVQDAASAFAKFRESY